MKGGGGTGENGGLSLDDIALEEVRLPCVNLNISSNILLQVQNGKAVL